MSATAETILSPERLASLSADHISDKSPSIRHKKPSVSRSGAFLVKQGL
jgi:hypothetical protein